MVGEGVRAGSRDQLGNADEAQELVGDIGGGDIGGEGVVGTRAVDGLPAEFGEVFEAAFQVGARRWPGGEQVDHRLVVEELRGHRGEEHSEARQSGHPVRKARLGELVEIGPGDGLHEALPGGEMAVEGAHTDAGRGGNGTHIHRYSTVAQSHTCSGEDSLTVGDGIAPRFPVCCHRTTIANRNIRSARGTLIRNQCSGKGVDMRTIVITGGTDGMGAALARHYLAVGDRVVVIGRDRAKFEALRDAAGPPATPAATGPAASDAGPVHAEFVAADLSSIADTRRMVDQLRREHERIDALVLAASYIRQRRHLTAEGYEASWVLFFVSKYLLVTGLAGRLRAATRPIVVNTAVPGARADAIDFDDPGMSRGFSFTRSNAQQRRANELLGILATAEDPNLAYVTWGPSGLVRTSFAGEVGPGMKISAAVFGTVLGKRPDAAVRPLIDLIDDPAPGRAAYRGTRPTPLVAGGHDREDIARLAQMIERDFR